LPEALHFTDEQLSWVERWREKERGYFVVLMVVAGSCAQKVYPHMPALARGLVEKHSDIKVYLMGDATTSNLSFGHSRIINISGQPPIKQAILMTREADFVFGGETGLLVAAGMFGTPKVMLCTSSGVMQACGRHLNDFSLQSSAKCSPCHRAVYCDLDCEGVVKDGNDEWHPECIDGFDHSEIFKTIEGVHALRNL
jgi:ADP-heptose:LPS heptosyltransferase